MQQSPVPDGGVDSLPASLSPVFRLGGTVSTRGEADGRPGESLFPCRGVPQEPSSVLGGAALSVFLSEKDVPGEGDLIRPQLGAVLHARRMGWNFAGGEESCRRWPSFRCVAACSRPRLLFGSWLGGAGLALPRKGVGGGLVYPDGVLDDRP